MKGRKSFTAAAKIGRVDQGGPVGIQLGDEGIPATPVNILERRIHRREVVGIGESRHVGFAGIVHNDVPAILDTAAAAEIGGIDQRGPRRAELGDEGVLEAFELPLWGIQGGKVSRRGRSRYVGAAGFVHGNTPAGEFIVTTTQESGIRERGPVGIQFGYEDVGGAPPRRLPGRD